MDNKKKIPVYEMFLDETDQDGVYRIAVTSAPAIERDFVALSKDEKQEIKYSTNEKEQIITGAIFIPDQLIFRKDRNGEAYYLKITKEEIKKVVQKFFKDGNHKFFNVEHDNNRSLSDIYVFESWIVGENDKIRELDERFSSEYIPAGSWVISAKVENPLLWKQIEEGTFTGFSMEGIFSRMEVDLNKELEELNKLIEELSSDGNALDKLRAIERFFGA